MGKTIRLPQSHKEELDATKPQAPKKSILHRTKKWLDPNLSSRKEHTKVKQHVWPFRNEKKKGHII